MGARTFQIEPVCTGAALPPASWRAVASIWARGLAYRVLGALWTTGEWILIIARAAPIEILRTLRLVLPPPLFAIGLLGLYALIVFAAVEWTNGMLTVIFVKYLSIPIFFTMAWLYVTWLKLDNLRPASLGPVGLLGKEWRAFGRLAMESPGRLARESAFIGQLRARDQPRTASNRPG